MNCKLPQGCIYHRAKNLSEPYTDLWHPLYVLKKVWRTNVYNCRYIYLEADFLRLSDVIPGIGDTLARVEEGGRYHGVELMVAHSWRAGSRGEKTVNECKGWEKRTDQFERGSPVWMEWGTGRRLKIWRDEWLLLESRCTGQRWSDLTSPYTRQEL